MENQPLPKLVDVNIIAAALNVETSTIQRWARQKKIPHYRLGNRLRFSLDEVSGWARKAKVDAV